MLTIYKKHIHKSLNHKLALEVVISTVDILSSNTKDPLDCKTGTKDTKQSKTKTVTKSHSDCNSGSITPNCGLKKPFILDQNQ